jgi:porin
MKALFLFAGTLVCFMMGNVEPALVEEVKPNENPSSSLQLGGPNSVGAQLKQDIQKKQAIIKYDLFGRALRPYFDFKRFLKEEYGLAIGFDYNALVQIATTSLGENVAAGGVVRFYGKWDLIGRDTGNTGSFVFKVENRHRLGTDISPVELGPEIGYAGLTTTTFSDNGWELTNLYWEQRLFNERFIIGGGVVDTTDYVNTYSMNNNWTDFNNQAFLSGPTIPSPSQGLGAAAVALLTKNIYILGGFADTNGDPTDPWESVNTFFDQAEYFSNIELGWISSFESRFKDNIHITAWHADKRKEAGVSNGWGLDFSFNRRFADNWEPFLRAGYANDGGALWDKNISIGLGYYGKQDSNLFALGLSWSEPSEENFGTDLKDQYTIELFYRIQLLQNFAITPDVQFLVNPALNPDEGVIGVFGFRARLTL